MSSASLYQMKLEKGNISTDWTPAPEDKADEIQTINFDTNNTEPTQAGFVTKTSTWLWQYLTQSINFLWLKLKDLFDSTQATTHNYLPKIDNANKKLVKSNIYDNGTNVGIGTTAPGAKLDISNSVALTENVPFISQKWSSMNSAYNLRLETLWGGTGINQNFIQKHAGTDKNVLSFYQGKVRHQYHYSI